MYNYHVCFTSILDELNDEEGLPRSPFRRLNLNEDERLLLESDDEGGNEENGIQVLILINFLYITFIIPIVHKHTLSHKYIKVYLMPANTVFMQPTTFR